MLRLTELAHQICRQVLSSGDIVIDATVGNGYDTLFLADAVGSTGQVFGFDIQPEALDQTRSKLEASEITHVTLIAGSHSAMVHSIPAEHHGRIRLVMFNLGYLPGGDKAVTTQTDSTLAALEAACRLIAPDGLISIVAYPGHPAGQAETAAVVCFLRQKQDEGWQLQTFHAVEDSDTAPRLYVLFREVTKMTLPD